MTFPTMILYCCTTSRWFTICPSIRLSGFTLTEGAQGNEPLVHLRLSIELFVYLNFVFGVFIESEKHNISLLACFTTSHNEWLNWRTIFNASFYSVRKRTKFENAKDISVHSQTFREERALVHDWTILVIVKQFLSGKNVWAKFDPRLNITRQSEACGIFLRDRLICWWTV